MKKVFAILLALCIAVLGCGCEKASDDRVIGAVNGENIYFWEFSFFLDSVKAELISQAGLATDEEVEEFWKSTSIDGTPATEVAKSKAFEQTVLFKEKVLLAKQAGCTLTSGLQSEINKQLSETKKSFGGEDEFKKALNEAGLTEDNYKSLLQDTYLVDLYAQKLAEEGAIAITDQQIEDYYNQNRNEFRTTVTAKHILFATVDESNQPKSEEEQAKAKAMAEDIYEKVSNNTLNFDEAMQEYSEDPGLAENPDGYTFSRGEMVAVFEDTAFNAAIGEICAPVQSDYGWHIIYVTDAAESTLEEVQDTIKNQLLNEAFEVYTQNAVQEFKVTRDNAVIDTVTF